MQIFLVSVRLVLRFYSFFETVANRRFFFGANPLNPWPIDTTPTTPTPMADGHRNDRPPTKSTSETTNKQTQTKSIFFLLSFRIRSTKTETLQQTTTRKKGTRETKQWRRRKQRTSERPAIIRSDADANIIKQRRRLRRAQHSTTIIPKYFFFLSLSLFIYIYIYIYILSIYLSIYLFA